ncbi:MAG: hypothetical protein KIS78_09305, partial [Labilithrix sp.]|nr:hypothetical protein [Labilithrix sp.]
LGPAIRETVGRREVTDRRSALVATREDDVLRLDVCRHVERGREPEPSAHGRITVLDVIRPSRSRGADDEGENSREDESLPLEREDHAGPVITESTFYDRSRRLATSKGGTGQARGSEWPRPPGAATSLCDQLPVLLLPRAHRGRLGTRRDIFGLKLEEITPAAFTSLG